LANITPLNVEEFAKAQKARGLCNKTVCGYVIILRAGLNFGLKHSLLRNNPVRATNLKFLKDRTPQLDEQPLDLSAVERAASVLTDAYEKSFLFSGADRR